MDYRIVSNDLSKTASIQKREDNAGFSGSLQKNKNNDFFYKKTQKIVTAVYLVTNFLPENDPLRESLRDSSIKLLSLIGAIVFSSHSSLQKMIYEVRSLSSQIISMLEIAFYAGYVSEMNHQILKKELEMYIDETSVLFSTLQNSFTLPEFSQDFLGEESVKDIIKDTIKDKGKYKGQKKPKVPPSLNESSPVYVKKQSRRELIIGLLQKKGEEATIKDISEVISDCSEKTIQRELSSLVNSGVLKKSGERRWSTYSLA